MRLVGAEAITTYTDGPLTDVPAVTRNAHGTGRTWYLATHPDAGTLATLLDRIRKEAGVEPVRTTPEGVEAALRRGEDADYLFLIDHTGQGAEVPVAPESIDLLTGKPLTGGMVTVAPGGVAVVREPRGGGDL